MERLANWRTLAAGSSSFAASASVVSATTRLVSSSCIRQRATAILQSACRPEMMHATGGRSGGRLCAAAFLALFCGASAAAVRFIDVDSRAWVGLRAPIVQDAPIVPAPSLGAKGGEIGQVDEKTDSCETWHRTHTRARTRGPASWHRGGGGGWHGGGGGWHRGGLSVTQFASCRCRACASRVPGLPDHLFAVTRRQHRWLPPRPRHDPPCSK